MALDVAAVLRAASAAALLTSEAAQGSPRARTNGKDIGNPPAALPEGIPATPDAQKGGKGSTIKARGLRTTMPKRSAQTGMLTPAKAPSVAMELAAGEGPPSAPAPPARQVKLACFLGPSCNSAASIRKLAAAGGCQRSLTPSSPLGSRALPTCATTCSRLAEYQWQTSGAHVSPGFKASPAPVLAAGMETAFLDFSSGQHSDHQKVLDSIRTVEQELGCTIAGAAAPVLQLTEAERVPHLAYWGHGCDGRGSWCCPGCAYHLEPR